MYLIWCYNKCSVDALSHDIRKAINLAKCVDELMRIYVFFTALSRIGVSVLGLA